LIGQGIFGLSRLTASNFLDFVAVLLVFLFVDIFDTVGTLSGVGMKAGYIKDDGKLPRVNQALFADAVGTTAGALIGTSTVTTYAESAAGVSEGGRTGFTAVIVGVLFILLTSCTKSQKMGEKGVKPIKRKNDVNHPCSRPRASLHPAFPDAESLPTR
jgi:xanthine/uracil/vitamin C permease (AzgA family)